MEFINIIVLVTIYVTLFITSFWLVVFLDNLPVLKKDPKPKKKYFISALIPAYNEGKNIVKTVRSLLNQDYPKELMEIIVINDGSTDSTRVKCELMEKKGWIKLINKPNGGKATALNAGIRKAKGELIYVLDADSYADRDSFKNLIGYFNDPKVAAVTSNMQVGKSDSSLRKIQWYEYLFNTLLRKVMSLFNSLYVTPGPGSIYRKSVLEKIGGFSSDTLTEDMEIAFNIQSHHYIIRNSLNSRVSTDAPKGLKSLMKQRRRWYAGFLGDSFSYKHLFFNRDNSLLGFFTLPVNFLTIGISIFLVSNIVRRALREAVRFAINFSAINYDFANLFRSFNLVNTFYSISVFSMLSILMLVLATIVIYYSLAINRKRFTLKNFILSIPYSFFYSPLVCIFWMDSIIYKLVSRGKGWKYG